MRFAHQGWLALVVPCLFGIGCSGTDVPKTSEPAKANEDKKTDDSKTPAPTGDAKERLLGALIPADDGFNYFVKFVGPVEKIDPNEKDFDAFLNSIRVPGEGGKAISWTAPAGWKEAPARAMRQVTLQKADGSSRDLYLSDPFGGGPLANVNRWLTEVGAKQITEAELPSVLKEIKLGDKKAYRVDLRGPGGKGGGMAPFMK